MTLHLGLVKTNKWHIHTYVLTYMKKEMAYKYMKKVKLKLDLCRPALKAGHVIR
jgi:hypothetical protein